MKLSAMYPYKAVPLTYSQDNVDVGHFALCWGVFFDE